ncbi:dnaJ homolog subfamily C member 21-like [Ischnura elegans]|uniref:dnaJ homolog subfamily C member 21-like n=1 Tax=Ischnura elegans TaxID=197161 RepID=UPI001ED8AACF|nr:dnaJ homolog subfamily C member 21-like [Ischnura elegans]
MRCHYEVLGVPRDADLQVLRAAYKKCALKWHPDKNLDNVEKAKEEFQVVQQAFEVLSDPHERAWYDTHREAILKGGLGKDYKDDSINLFPYYSSSCYQGYGDDDKGFYAVYREVFHQIYAEDVDFDPEEKPDESVPTFGKSDSSYEEVVHPFYAYWENYCTTKTYVWLDEFDVREAPNRRVMRLMEKENKKLREKAKKQRNEEIRQLVRFVRKRDKRLEEHRKNLAEKAAENAKKVEMNRRRQLEERKREIAEAKEADWVKMHNIERELQEIESHLADEFGDHTTEEDIDEEDGNSSASNHLYCVACNKMFKNENSFANHESSKKHKENVAALNLTVDCDIKDDDLNGLEEEDEILNSEEEEKPSKIEEVKSSSKKKKSKKVLKPIDDSLSNGCSPHLDLDSSEGESFKKSAEQSKKKSRRRNSKVESVDTEVIAQQNDDSKCEEAEQFPKPISRPEKMPETRKKKVQSDNQNKSAKDSSKDLKNTCAVCNSSFTSKNKLFNHLKSTGHSVYIPKSSSTEEEKPSRRRK